MEDQLNRTDDSFNTYCRPLGRPGPFALPAGETIRQRIVVKFEMMSDARDRAVANAVSAKATPSVMPQFILANEVVLCGDVTAAVTQLEVGGSLLRVEGAAPKVVSVLRAPVAVEFVTLRDDGDRSCAR